MNKLIKQLLNLTKDVEISIYENAISVDLSKCDNRKGIDLCKDMIRMRMILTWIRKNISDEDKQNIEVFNIRGNSCIPSMLIKFGLFKVFGKYVALQRTSQFEYDNIDSYIDDYRNSIIYYKTRKGEFQQDIVKILTNKLWFPLVEVSLL